MFGWHDHAFWHQQYALVVHSICVVAITEISLVDLEEDYGSGQYMMLHIGMSFTLCLCVLLWGNFADLLQMVPCWFAHKSYLLFKFHGLVKVCTNVFQSIQFAWSNNTLVIECFSRDERFCCEPKIMMLVFLSFNFSQFVAIDCFTSSKHCYTFSMAISSLPGVKRRYSSVPST